MKAFVIKNKEGKYLYVFYVYEDENYAFGELNTAMLFKDVYNANIYVDKVKMLNSRIDCEVVEVTIAEGDLEQELAIYKRAFELAKLDGLEMDDYIVEAKKGKNWRKKVEISKERLEELIKQGATIYWLCGDFVSTTRLNNLYYISECNILCKNNINGKECVVYLKDLYETRKQAEWALKYQHIPRTEELNLPMWEEVKNIKNKNVVSFYAKNSRFGVVCIHIFIKYFSVESEYEVFLNTEFTEENYIKACDLCLKLFKGEEG